MSSQTNNEVIAPQKNRTILQLPILGDLNDDNWLLVTSNNSTYRIEAGVFARLLGALALDKVDLGLDQVDNTSDMDKPISNATMGALEGKSDISHTHEVSDIEGLKEFVDNILDSTLEIRSYVRSDVLELMLNAKADKAEILEYLDNKVDKDTLEILVTNEELETALALKADKAFVETLAVQADVDEALALKADKTDIQALDFSKADKADVLNFATRDELTDRLVAKLDVSAAEGFITRLAMEEALEEKVGKDELTPYATKEEVGLDLSFKADKTALDALATKSELAEGLDGKIDKIVAGTYATKQELTSYHTKEEVDEALGLKLNISDFEDAVADIQAQKGDKGDPGRDGVDGAPGADGLPGADGKDGEDGAPGVDGKSAYELALDNGFTGTLVEWLASLKGEKGDKGDPGEGGSGGTGGETTVITKSSIFDFKNLLLDTNFERTLNGDSNFGWEVVRLEDERILGSSQFIDNTPESPYTELLQTTSNIMSAQMVLSEDAGPIESPVEVFRFIPRFLNQPSNLFKVSKTDIGLVFSIKYNLPVHTSIKLRARLFNELEEEINVIENELSDPLPITEDISETPERLYDFASVERSSLPINIPADAAYISFEIGVYLNPQYLDNYPMIAMFMFEPQLELGLNPTDFEQNDLLKNIKALTSGSDIKMMELYSMYYASIYPVITWDYDVEEDFLMPPEAHGKTILYDGRYGADIQVPSTLPNGFRCDIVVGDRYPETNPFLDIEGETLVWASGVKKAATRSHPISIAKLSDSVIMVYGGEEL